MHCVRRPLPGPCDAGWITENPQIPTTTRKINAGQLKGLVGVGCWECGDEFPAAGNACDIAFPIDQDSCGTYWRMTRQHDIHMTGQVFRQESNQ